MRWKPLSITFGILAFLWVTFLSPWTSHLWEGLDLAIFQALNGTLKDSKFTQIFWALINHKRMDLVEDVIFILFFIRGVAITPKQERREKIAQFIAVIVMAASVIFFINRNLLRHNVLIPRDSPTLTVSPCVKITDHLPWPGLKDETIASFPGDHATTLLLFGFLFSAFVPKRLALAAWAYVIFRALPRVVVGAHWFSDIAVGSMTIALFFAACFLYTPLGKVMTTLFIKKGPHDIEKEPV